MNYEPAELSGNYSGKWPTFLYFGKMYSVRTDLAPRWPCIIYICEAGIPTKSIWPPELARLVNTPTPHNISESVITACRLYATHSGGLDISDYLNKVFEE